MRTIGTALTKNLIILRITRSYVKNGKRNMKKKNLKDKETAMAMARKEKKMISKSRMKKLH